MKNNKKILLFIIALIIISATIILAIAFSPVMLDERNLKKALENNIPVEEVKPSDILDAEKLTADIICNRSDTVFLGYYFGMTKEDAINLTKNNRKSKKLYRKSDGCYYYDMKVYDGSNEISVPFLVRSCLNFIEKQCYIAA